MAGMVGSLEATTAGQGSLLSDQLQQETSRTKLRWWNIANLVGYVANFGFTYASLTGVFGETNSDLSRKYQTLVTPAGFTFSIWGLIFTWEAVFAAAQMLPRFRAAEVVRVVALPWLGSCAAQILWTVAFAQEMIWFSEVCMLLILLNLLALVAATDGLKMTTLEYWALRAPFSLQLGWIIAASLVNTNVTATAANASPATLLMVAVGSFATVAAIVTAFASALRRPDFIVCLVAAWAFFGIRSQLQDPAFLDDAGRINPHRWDRVTLSGLEGAATLISVYALALALVAAVRRAAPPCFARKDGDSERR